MPVPTAKTLDEFLRAEAIKMRGKDAPPTSRKEWDERRATLRKAMQEAMGPIPEKDCPLDAKVLGVLKRDGYSIERVVFQSRPGLTVTANAYVPTGIKGKTPAVLVVHGHWAAARRDPVVQARCLGLVKLGFFVLALDAFGSGERYTAPALRTYHGALYGSTLWPTGHTLLGMQVYDNRRAVDYLCTRPEVDATKLGVTGASGGGNQSMYAGAMDDRFAAVVPVCSVGTYQAYLHAACCVCEVLPGAMKFTEESGVLSLVAPRALMVINATMDGFQFSVGEAKKSIEAARPVFKLLDAGEKLKHVTFESPHAYNQAMREAMYGWMTLHLKGEGKGEPIPEPAHKIETWDDLACWPGDTRPKDFLLLPAFAHREATALVKKCEAMKPKHAEDWEARSTLMKATLRKQVLGGLPSSRAPEFVNTAVTVEGITTSTTYFDVEPGLTIRVVGKHRKRDTDPVRACILIHLDGGAAAVAHPVHDAIVKSGRLVLCPDLRGTGAAKPEGEPFAAAAPDHNSAQHSLWAGRPLLGQWVADIRAILLGIASVSKSIDPKQVAVVGIGQGGPVALAAAVVLDDLISSTALIDGPISYVVDRPYAAGTRMGTLAPGILRVGDIPHLAALLAPRKLHVVGGTKPEGGKVEGKQLAEAFAFTRTIYQLHKKEKDFSVVDALRPEELANGL